MSDERTRKIVVAGLFGALAAFLGFAQIGYIQLPAYSLTFIQVTVIIAAVLEGPIVGGVVGLIFGITSLVIGNMRGGNDAIFVDPTISILPRLFIGPVAWLVWRAFKNRVQAWKLVGLGAAGVVGSLTNSVLVLGMIVLHGLAPLEVAVGVLLGQGLVEAALSGTLTLLVVAAWMRLPVGKRKGADL